MTPPASIGDAAQAAQLMSAYAQRLAGAGLTMRPPPSAPTTCCGRGCNGCVWEGYFAAVTYWVEQAHGLLASPSE